MSLAKKKYQKMGRVYWIIEMVAWVRIFFMSFSKESDKEFEQLGLLFEYTKFHILLYTTLITLLIGLFAFGISEGDAEQFRRPMKIVVFFFLLAGGAGGVIGSSIPRFHRFSDFCEASISPYGMRFLRFKGRTWTHIEHGAFWVGIVIAVASFLLA